MRRWGLRDSFRPSRAATHLCTSLSRLMPRNAYAGVAKVQPRIALIVSPAAQPEVLERALTTHRKRIDVVELEAPPRAAPPPIFRDITAPLPISQKHRPRHRGRAVARPFRSGVRPGFFALGREEMGCGEWIGLRKMGRGGSRGRNIWRGVRGRRTTSDTKIVLQTIVRGGLNLRECMPSLDRRDRANPRVRADAAVARLRPRTICDLRPSRVRAPVPPRDVRRPRARRTPRTRSWCEWSDP